MTSGSEATDTACKLARGWGVDIKKTDPREVLVLGTSDNYHRTLSGVWPLTEPNAGWEVTLPRTMEEEIDFCIGVWKLCKQYNILFIADEVRMGSC
ncbi:hypothetical protein CLIM01_10169 [Colletotrichum limetticola]|uniref:Ornithine aminotransferase n=1 Tax=Colletotrichum limetticola TaxID=1209924 RepID=A0ABQ9PKW5_9PEZI|nr:hypothetical protein CLIM01_10169 [Colletotrichum limetticola]